MSAVKPILITSGEPAGIGPDLCLSLITQHTLPVVVIGDRKVFTQRALQLNLNIKFIDYITQGYMPPQLNQLNLLESSCLDKVIAGELNVANAAYVLQMLEQACQLCINKEFAAVVTAPVHKAILNQAGICFTGHTEFFAQFCKAEVVMMLVCEAFRVALVTTHLPLKQVAENITMEKIQNVLLKVHAELKSKFNIIQPKLAVAGLNPHAGESGYLGHEEIEIINPIIAALRTQGLEITDALPADTLFIPKNLLLYDAFIAMYHDQGLPILKHLGFGQAVNVTLGLPFIRTSVDHGTALELAGTGKAQVESLFCATKLAIQMAQTCQL